MARGFGPTRGAGANDEVITGFTTDGQTRTYGVRYKRNGAGGGNAGRIMSKGTTGEWMRLLYNNNAGVNCIEFLRQFNAANNWRITGSTIATTGVWNHLIIIFDEVAPNQPVAYINGALASVTSSVPSGARQDFAESLSIGNNGSLRAFDGDLAELIIWNALLTADEAIAFTSGWSGRLIRPASQIMNYELIREIFCRRNSGTPTVIGTSVQDGPPIRMPRKPVITTSAAAPAPTSPIHRLRFTQQFIEGVYQ